MRITRANSFLKHWRQPAGEGGIPMKIRSFCYIHKLQQNIIMTSMKKGRFVCSLISSRAAIGSASTNTMLSLIQHACAKDTWTTSVRVFHPPPNCSRHNCMRANSYFSSWVDLWCWVCAEEATKRKIYVYSDKKPSITTERKDVLACGQLNGYKLWKWRKKVNPRCRTRYLALLLLEVNSNLAQVQ